MLTRMLFATFVVLIAMRDILSELWLEENPIVFAFMVSSVTAGISILHLSLRGGFQDLVAKLRRPAVLIKALPLGALSAFIYGLGYYLVKQVGAGLFNVVDYGITPLATLVLGKLMFGEKLGRSFTPAFIFYCAGLIMLNVYRSMTGILFLIPILAIPVAVSLSDALTKWLLGEDKGGLSKEELLIVRFLPGALVTAALCYSTLGGIPIEKPVALITVSLACGWLPLWILCTVLAKANLSQLAYWELVIPALAFFGTLHLHQDSNARFIPVLGALLILTANPLANWITEKSKRTKALHPSQG